MNIERLHSILYQLQYELELINITKIVNDIYRLLSTDRPET